MRRAIPLLLGLAGLLAGCSTTRGVHFPFGGGRGPALPDSAAIRARLQDERLQRLEQSSAEQERLLRRMNAEVSAQIETLTHEVRTLGDRLEAIERRLSTARAEPAQVPAAGAGAPVPPDAQGSAPTGEGTVLPEPSWTPPIGSTDAAPVDGGARDTGDRDLSDPPEDGQRLYDSAYQDLMSDNYQLALMSFRGFRERYPRSQLSDNAQYWIGEVYYEQKQFGVAVEEFRKVVEEYPDQDKVPAAYYKMALCFRALRDAATARRYLDLLIERYPSSREAQLAKERRAEF